MKDDRKHLTTGKDSDISNLLEPLAGKPMLLILVAVNPRNDSTGLLTEQGEWVLNIWDKLLDLFPNIIGCRISWNLLFFAIDYQFSLEVEKKFEEVLMLFTDEKLKSICLTMESNGKIRDAVESIDEMQQETSSKFDFCKILTIRSRFVDGKRIKVK